MSSQKVNILNDYLLGDQVGEGRFTDVYSAIKRGLGKKVALMVLKPQYGSQMDARDNFIRRARFASKLKHPQIVDVFDVADDSGRLYMAMEFIPQGSLRDWIKKLNGNIMPLHQIAALIDDVAHALNFIHTHKGEDGNLLIHGSVNPGNILLEYDTKIAGKLRAKLSGGGIWQKSQDKSDTGELFPLENPEYISPEQASDVPLSPYSDQYALGIITYELLTSQTPFHGDSLVTIYRNHKTVSPPSPSTINRSLTREIEEIVLKSLNKDPLDRFENCEQFARALRLAVESTQEKDFVTYLEQARQAVDEVDASTAVIALRNARQIKPNSIEVERLLGQTETLERAAALYKEGCDSFSNASQLAKEIRNSEPNYPDEEGLLANLAPLPDRSWQRFFKRWRIALIVSLALIGFVIVLGIVANIYING